MTYLFGQIFGMYTCPMMQVLFLVISVSSNFLFLVMNKYSFFVYTLVVIWLDVNLPIF